MPCGRSPAAVNRLTTIFKKPEGMELNEPDRPSRTGSTMKGWEVRDIYEDRSYGCPHAVMILVQNITATSATDHYFTSCEIKAIIRVLRIRSHMEGYLKHNNLPLLVLSIMGPNHGRMLQASFNGGRIVIQRSQLFDFVAGSRRVMQLFVRYAVSQPVGGHD
ncbi:hypothetical protein BDV25DRAFT_148037 [Aspergillus avenaceus]|uniref:Uncharacterized protein n=1 Tax=Aspergillus avenaceus TaxID=36643 RepID=A0A5N6U6D2_ASPAV|nr:hypothetical protein BDV25DRAFT_148037 [Aspergillus avenaceus]